MARPEHTVTMRLHVPWEAGSSERLYAACRTQDACWKLALDFLIEHPGEPLRKSKRLGVKGLQGRWLEWREEPQVGEKAVPQAIWRGGVLRAKSQVERWEQVNETHARACLRRGRGREGNLPRRVQRRHPDPTKLYRRRKDRDRQLRNTCLVTEGVKRIDAYMSCTSPGWGRVHVRERLDEDFEPRSCTIVETTTEDRARRCGRHMKGRDRSFEVHVQVRVPVGTGEVLERLEAVGIDHGLVHPITTCDTARQRALLPPPGPGSLPPLTSVRRKSRGGFATADVGPGVEEAPAPREEPAGPAANIRSHDRHQWAVDLAKGYGTVCVERMGVRQLIRSARGTHESHGELVNVQRETVEATRERGARRTARGAQSRMRTPRTKVHRDPGEELVGLLSGVRALQPGKPQEPSAIPVPGVRARRQRGLQCSEEPLAVRDIREAQGRGQAVLGGGDSSEAPSWRGQPGQGTEGKPGQRPGAATGPRARADPASRKGLSARRCDGHRGERVRGSSTCGSEGACHLLMGLCHHLFPHLRSATQLTPIWMVSCASASDLDRVIERYQPELLIHGHMREPVDERLGRTRLLANAGGYRHENERDSIPTCAWS